MARTRTFYTDPFTRGGQVFSHEWRMRLQNLKLVFFLSLPFLLLGFWVAMTLFKVTLWDLIDFYILSYGGGYLKIYCLNFMKPFLIWLDSHLKGGSGIVWASYRVNDLMTDLRFPQGHEWHLRTVVFLKHPWVIKHSALIGRACLTLWGVWLGSMMAIYYILKRKSLRLESEKIMEGKALMGPRKLAKLLRHQRRASHFKLTPQLSLLKEAETQHMMVIGTTGAGKTNCIHGLLKQIAVKKQAVIVLDTNGGYVNRYYDSERGDKVLNPFDRRSVYWDLWKDCTLTSDFDQFATALIPEPSSSANPVWHKNAREIISTTAEKLALEGTPRLQTLIENASWKALHQVKTFFKDTPVESLMSAQGRAEETVHGVRMQMTEAMKRLALIPQTGEPFSISEWVKEAAPGAWLFISCTENDRSTLGPLMKFWISVAIQGLLKRGEDIEHRLWFILDELFSLEGGSVPNLLTLLREGRKYGGCGVLGFQSLAGLEKEYGAVGMREVVTLCNTKVILRTPEPQTASYLSQVLGEKEVLEAGESLSMGAHHMRDGVSLSSQRRLKPVVSKTDMMTLRSLQAYVSLGSDLPITQVTFPLIKVPLKFKQQEYQRNVSLLSLLKEQGDRLSLDKSTLEKDQILFLTLKEVAQ